MTVKPVNPVAEKQARAMAAENRQTNPDITTILWFPDDQEIRFVELTDEVPIYIDEELSPFYFRASPEDDLPLPTAIAMIRPNERGKLKLPAEWGDWNDAVEL
jgi:hypothetical protein